jgi:hypothetical protein
MDDQRMKRIGYSYTFDHAVVKRALRAMDRINAAGKAVPGKPRTLFRAIGIVFHDRTLNKG